MLEQTCGSPWRARPRGAASSPAEGRHIGPSASRRGRGRSAATRTSIGPCAQGVAHAGCPWALREACGGCCAGCPRALCVARGGCCASLQDARQLTSMGICIGGSRVGNSGSTSSTCAPENAVPLGCAWTEAEAACRAWLLADRLVTARNPFLLDFGRTSALRARLWTRTRCFCTFVFGQDTPSSSSDSQVAAHLR